MPTPDTPGTCRRYCHFFLSDLSHRLLSISQLRILNLAAYPTLLSFLRPSSGRHLSGAVNSSRIRLALDGNSGCHQMSVCTLKHFSHAGGAPWITSCFTTSARLSGAFHISQSSAY